MPFVTSRDGTSIAYDVTPGPSGPSAPSAPQGAPALVYITGAICFRKFLPIVGDIKVFSKEFTVYCYDRRGRGDSGDTPPWSLEREIEDLEAVLDAVARDGHGKACLYGHSSGAVLALEAALRLPAKVDKALIYDAPYVRDAEEKASFDALGDDVRRLLRDGKRAPAVRAFLKGIGTPGIVTWLMSLMPGWRLVKALAPTLAYDIALTRDEPPVERAAGIRVPVLVAAGENSPAGIPDVARKLAIAIPQARLEILPGQNHMVAAKVLLPHMVRFFKG